MRDRVLWLLASILAVAAVPEAQAQQREITGKVVSSTSAAPLSGAGVVLEGTNIGVLTNETGNFVLSAPAGDARLRVTLIGHKSKQVVVPAGQGSVTIPMETDVLNLEGLVVTGQATSVKRQNLAHAVASVSSQELDRAPSPTVDKALQGKVAGANISTNSGAPGGGVQVSLRGVSTFKGSAEPLWVVDGVVVSNVAIPSGANAVTAASGGSNASTQDAPVNRIADLNPNDIESIEILKGASASAIYGSKASNGVIIIKTKTGRAGAPRVAVGQKVGFYQLSNTLGSRTFETVDEAVDAFGEKARPFFGADGKPLQVYDLERELAGREAPSFQTNFSVSGGNENTRYYLSALVQDEEGVIQNTGFDRQSVKLSVDQKLGERVDVGLSANVIHSVASRGLTNNDNTNTSFYMALSATPNFVDLRALPDGTFPENPFTFSNPLQTAALMSNDEDVWRAITSLNASVQLMDSDAQSLRLVAVGGVDYFRQRNDLYFPAELQFEPNDGLLGTAILGNNDNLNMNGTLNLIHTFSPAGMGFTATTSGGLQYEDRDLRLALAVGRNLIAGQRHVGAAASKNVTNGRYRSRDLGVYLQEELLLLDEKLLLTAGVRADRSSNIGDPNQFFFYPKASASYRMPDVASFADEVKFRLAYGESGNLPLFGYKFTPYTATGNIEGEPGLVVGGNAGDPLILPERQREIEGGVDLTLLEGNATLEVTAYQRNIGDFLLERAVAPSTGFTTQYFNGGELRTRGLEVALAATPLRAEGFSWFTRTTFSTYESEVTDLPVPPFRTGGFGLTYGAFQIEEGASPTQILGYNGLDENGNKIVAELGDASPDFRMGFNNDLAYRRFSLSSLLDWQKGGDVVNLTRLLFDAYGVSEDFELPAGVDEPRSIGECNPNCSGLERISGAGLYTGQYVEDASYLKLRELSLSYDMPVEWLRGFVGGVSSAQLSLSGRNLVTITDYSGLDPEVSNFGNQAVARNIDVAPFPPSRSFWLTLNLGF